MTTPKYQNSDENKTIVFTSPSNTTVVYTTGDIVGESYILLSRLARGGMGVLFKAKHIQLDRIFALKLLPPNQVSEVNWRRFEIEGRALAKLSHPNIVQIYNMGVDQKGCPFYVMELLEGQSMAEYIEQQTMPIEQFVQSFKDVCAALQLTHSKGIVHRDIKPSNLFMVQTSASSSSSSSSSSSASSQSSIRSTKVVDFGIARLTANEGQDLQGLTRPGEVFGSPAYMSPEQTEGKAVTLASDIYSLGCTMYAALAGHAPFKGATALQTMMSHQADLAPPINRLDFSPEQNNACNEIIASCMEKAPENRVSNVEQIAEMLGKISTDLSSAVSNTKLRQHREPESKRESNNDQIDETTTNSNRARAKNQNKWLTIAAASTLSLAAVVVAVTSANHSVLFNQSEAPKTNDLKAAKPTSAQIHEASIKLHQEKMPALADEINLDDFILQTNEALSEVVEIDGKKHRIFNFPTKMSIGRVAQNRTREEIFKTNGRSNERLEKAAQGKITWPDDEPVNFVAGVQISKIPEAYEHFDDQAIASLTLKNPERLPGIETLANWPNLRSLHLHDCILDATYTKGLDRLEHLKSLTLDHTKFDVEALTGISVLARLSSLQLDSIEDHSKVLHALEYIRSLTYLELRNLILNESNLMSLKKLHNLNQLDLRYSTLPDMAMAELSRLPNLHILNLDRTIYSPQSLYDLASSKSLRTLYVDKDRPSEQVLIEFRKRCPHVYVHRKPQRNS
ncbi:MAG: protein kinase [Candidatus Obscuribacterales bacterium]